MALIKRIVTGQTFGNWLDTTNKLIDDINASTANRGPNKLVRYDNTGSLQIKDIQANSFFLDMSTSSIRIDTIADDFTNVGYEKDNVIFTANATYAAIKAEAKNIIKNAQGHATATEFVEVNGAPSAPVSNVSFTLDGTQVIEVLKDKTTFKQDVEITGDLSVLGDSTEFNTQTLTVTDNNIVLNKGGSTFTAEDGGFDIFKTNAHFRLVNSGNRFPYDVSGTDNNVLKLNLHIAGKRRNFYFDRPSDATIGAAGISKLSEKHFYNTELLSADEEVRNININTKDALIIEYDFDATEPISNAVPFAIGTSSGATRETNVLEPNFGNFDSTANSVITYQIGSIFYKTYEDYKDAFLNTRRDSGDTVKITFKPDQETSYYLWAGSIPAVSYEGQTHTTSSGRFTSDIIIDGSADITRNNLPNYDYKVVLGDTVKLTIDLFTSADKSPVYISTKPFNWLETVAGHSEYRANDEYVLIDGHPMAGAVTYEVYDAGAGLVNTYTDKVNYESAVSAAAATSGSMANVIFNPNDLTFADTFNFYYWNTANNHTTLGNDFGGEIQVSANNTGMGGEIETTYPMGLYFEKELTPSTATTLKFAGVESDVFKMDAGSTLKLTNGMTEAFWIASNTTPATPLDYRDGVTYEIGGKIYKDYTTFAAAYTAASSANVIFTPLATDVYSYQSVSVAGNHVGRIEVVPAKDRSLSAFELTTDTKEATFENPRAFKVTKNHNPVMTLDGSIADFRGTKNGLLLPADALAGGGSDGLIRYNPGIRLFEGFTNGTWRGLGGVIDLDQDTEIKAHDDANILEFIASGNHVSKMAANAFFINSTTINEAGTANTGTANIVSNWNVPAQFEINVDGTRDYGGTNQVTSKSKIQVNPDGIRLDATGYLKIPFGTTAERPTVAEDGMLRYTKDAFKVQLYDASGAAIPGASGQKYFNAIEMWDDLESAWRNISSVATELTQTAGPSQGNHYAFTDCLEAWDKQDLDVYINGLRIQKSDYTLLNTLPALGCTTSDSVTYAQSLAPNVTNVLDFNSLRLNGQIITVVYRPSQRLGVTEIDAISRTEVISTGLPSLISQTVTVSGTTPSKDIYSGALTVAGGLGVQGDIFTQTITETSALALKENISPIESAIDKVKQLNGVQFSWKKDYSQQATEYGLIAEDVHKITPNLVSSSDGKPQGVKYSKVVALLIEAVKQQQEQIDELKSQLPKKRVRKTKSQ